jgi:hypothetical protein
MNDCSLHPFERNRYFYGKLLTVRDFETEQSYFIEKNRLVNRLIHGKGIIYGLEADQPQIDDGDSLTIELSEGVALDCCGNEIVFPQKGIVTAKGTFDDGLYFLYLKYAEYNREPVPCLSNASACEEVCCYSRIRETFEVVISSSAPATAPDDAEPGDCCDQTDDNPGIFIAAVNILGKEVAIDTNKTSEYRTFVYNNPLLRHLLESLKKQVDLHLNDFENPHGTTAAQAGALVSIDGVSNPGGNIALSAGNSISITADNNNKAITISESHSVIEGNPHNTRHASTGPEPVNPENSDTARNKHVSDADSGRWNRSLTGIRVNGETILQNPGSFVDLKAGKNIILTADESGNSLAINANAGLEARTGQVVIKTNEKGHGTATVNSGFTNEHFFVYIGLEQEEYIEYGSSFEFAGHVLSPRIRIFRKSKPTIVPTIGPIRPAIEPTIGPIRPPLGILEENDTGYFSIIINEPDLGSQSIPFVWFAVPGQGYIPPTIKPTIEPTIVPTIIPTIKPTIIPTIGPTIIPTIGPTIEPTIVPTIKPTIMPTAGPVIEREISEVSGINEEYSSLLKSKGINNLSALASAEPGDVAKILGTTEITAMSFIDEAKRLLR